jgi:hypothetical protein
MLPSEGAAPPTVTDGLDDIIRWMQPIPGGRGGPIRG